MSDERLEDMPDGGGCTEAWETLSAYRNDRDIDSDTDALTNGQKQKSRRSVLGMSGMALASLGGALMSRESSPPSIAEPISPEIRREAEDLDVEPKSIAELEKIGVDHETRQAVVHEALGDIDAVPMGLFGCPNKCVNPSALLRLAGTYVGSVAACGACVGSASVFVPACGLCLAGIGATAGSFGNGWCDSDCAGF